MRAAMSRAQHVGTASGGSPRARAGARLRRAVIALSVVAGLGAAADAQAFTSTLAFPDGQPMTYGSACAGLGCLDRNERRRPRPTTRGRVFLPDAPRTIEYRRDGIDLGALGAGTASGNLPRGWDAATVVLPRVLIGSAPAVDAVESDLVARLNEARAAEGLPLAQMNSKLSAAADYQATWLAQSGVTILQPDRFHVGPFGSDLGFRHGEVSLPDAGSGGEIAEAGGTIDETVSDWLSSADHRSLVLAPGRMTHRRRPRRLVRHRARRTAPCGGCEQAGTGTRDRADAPPPPPPAVAPVSVAAPPVAGRRCRRRRHRNRPAGASSSSVRRLADRGGRVRLRVAMHCLRPGARYALLIRQGTTGRLLRTMAIKRAGATMLRLRPSRTATQLRIKLKRDGRAIVARTIRWASADRLARCSARATASASGSAPMRRSNGPTREPQRAQARQRMRSAARRAPR